MWFTMTVPRSPLIFVVMGCHGHTQSAVDEAELVGSWEARTYIGIYEVSQYTDTG